MFTVEQMEATVRGLYLGILGREADKPGLAYWISVWREGAELQTVAEGLVNSEENRHRIGAADISNQVIERAIGAARRELHQMPLTIVDVGAQMLPHEEHVYSPLIRHDLPNRIIGFEPLEHRRRERLADLHATSSVTILSAFIGDGLKHSFHINRPDATSSLLPFNREVIDHFVDLDELTTGHVELVTTITLDDALIGELDIHFLKLDIQGFELSALWHAQKTLQRTLVVHCEVEFMEIYKGQPLFSEVEQYMRGAGFGLMDLRSVCRYPFANTPFRSSRDWLGWADAVFFRRFDDNFSWQECMAQSIIALAVYDKPSLAAWLVRNMGDTPAGDYSRILNSAPFPLAT